ncbi:MAG: class I SAM-dependent methyltransferase [bacterium]|nr:class I SAM-dependent methyltransferase [bacterium]
MKYKYRNETRTKEQILKHYEIEVQLANKLKNASKEERKILYSTLYNEMYEKLKEHPQNQRKSDKELQEIHVNTQINFLKRFIEPHFTFLEVGPGDCALAFKISKSVKKVIAVDVSDFITENGEEIRNFELIISDGSSVPVEPQTVDIAYSYQLMEHLHPDDAVEQLLEIYKALKNNGKYICITPNRLSGPHDISMYFDEVAKGFHLKEYSFSELLELMKKAGFKKFKGYWGARGKYIRVPIFKIKLFEKFLMLFKIKLRRKIANFLPIKLLLGITIVAIK